LRNRNDPWAKLCLTDTYHEIKVFCSIPENIRTFSGMLFAISSQLQQQPDDETLPLSLLPEKSRRCSIYLPAGLSIIAAQKNLRRQFRYDEHGEHYAG